MSMTHERESVFGRGREIDVFMIGIKIAIVKKNLNVV